MMSTSRAAVTPSGEVVVVTKPAQQQQQQLLLVQHQHPSTGSLVPTVTDAESLSVHSNSSCCFSENSAIIAPQLEGAPDEGSASTTPTITTTTSTSILKSKSTDPSYFKDTQKAWKCLRKPDLKSLLSSSFTESTKSAESNSLNHAVHWGIVRIRSYSQTVGDNPSVSYGPPISLDWEYEQHDDVLLEDYELSRGTRRTLRQMVLSYYHRKNVLSWQYGVTQKELKQAKRQAERAKLLRSVTRSFLPTMPAEAVVESARRKAKRLFTKQQS